MAHHSHRTFIMPLAFITTITPMQFCKHQRLTTTHRRQATISLRQTPRQSMWPKQPDEPQNPASTERREDTEPTSRPHIPQTIEYAIGQAQEATEHALCEGLTNLRIELPMGRARGHWYVLSPIASWYTEATILAFHYAEMFKGLHITMVLGCGPGVTHPVPWISEMRRLEDETPPEPQAVEGRVVIFAAVSTSQYDQFTTRVSEVGTPDAMIMFNCFLDRRIDEKIPPFQICYMCRAFNKVAILRERHSMNWSIFIEIAVFEFEWVGDKPLLEDWSPVQENVEMFALANGAFNIKRSKYFATRYSGCEAGFWPFMTVSCRDVLPLDGEVLEREERVKNEGKRKKPFGFF